MTFGIDCIALEAGNLWKELRPELRKEADRLLRKCSRVHGTGLKDASPGRTSELEFLIDTKHSNFVMKIGLLSVFEYVTIAFRARKMKLLSHENGGSLLGEVLGENK